MMVVLGIAIAVLIVVAIVQARRGRRLLERWATNHGYQLLRVENRALLRGPFFGTASKTQDVFRFTAIDEHVETFKAWACVGGPILGKWSNKVQVKVDHSLDKQRLERVFE